MVQRVFRVSDLKSPSLMSRCLGLFLQRGLITLFDDMDRHACALDGVRDGTLARTNQRACPSHGR